MISQKDLDRIGELARKKKAEGLTETEQAEQKLLYDRFLADFRSRFKQQLDNIELVDEDDPRLKNQNN